MTGSFCMISMLVMESLFCNSVNNSISNLKVRVKDLKGVAK